MGRSDIAYCGDDHYERGLPAGSLAASSDRQEVLCCWRRVITRLSDVAHKTYRFISRLATMGGKGEGVHQLVGADGFRARGRLATQMRPLLSERGVLTRADGSAKWVQDGTALLAAVHGPVQAGQRREDAERAVVEVVWRPRSGLPGPEQHEAEELLRCLLERVLLTALHPRTAVTLVLHVLQADGSLLAAAANAACAALADAGLPMASMFACVCCAYGHDGTLVVDPDAAEEQAAAAVVSAAFPCSHSLDSGEDGGNQQLLVPAACLLLHVRGRLTTAQLATALEACRRGCQGVAKFAALSLVNSLRDELVRGADPSL